jgi:hypothetical protein
MRRQHLSSAALSVMLATAGITTLCVAQSTPGEQSPAATPQPTPAPRKTQEDAVHPDVAAPTQAVSSRPATISDDSKKRSKVSSDAAREAARAKVLRCRQHREICAK